jgi:hypothetical protein
MPDGGNIPSGDGRAFGITSNYAPEEMFEIATKV